MVLYSILCTFHTTYSGQGCHLDYVCLCLFWCLSCVHFNLISCHWFLFLPFFTSSPCILFINHQCYVTSCHLNTLNLCDYTLWLLHDRSSSYISVLAIFFCFFHRSRGLPFFFVKCLWSLLWCLVAWLCCFSFASSWIYVFFAFLFPVLLCFLFPSLRSCLLHFFFFQYAVHFDGSRLNFYLTSSSHT